MADKQISELTAGTIGNNNDAFMFDNASGVTYKLPYSDLAGAIIGQSIGAGTGINITTDTSSTLYKKNISIDADTTPTQNSQKPVTSGGVYTALLNKQDTLTFDSTPTQNSTNPVTSGGVYDAIQQGGGGGGSADPADAAYSVGNSYASIISRGYENITVDYLEDGEYKNQLTISRDLTRFSDEYENSGDFWSWLYIEYKVNYGYVNNDGKPDTLKTGDYIDVDLGSLGTARCFLTNIRGGNTHTGAYGEIDFMLKFDYSHAITKAFNDTATNNGTSSNPNTFRASDMYYFLNSQSGTTPSGASVNYTSSGVYYYLPSELKAYILEKTTFAGTRYQNGSALTENGNPANVNLGKLWLPSEIEVFGYTVNSDGGKSLAGLDRPMPYFTNSANWYAIGNDQSNALLLRDPVKGSSTDMCAFEYDLTNDYVRATTVSANAPCELPVCFTVGITNY